MINLSFWQYLEKERESGRLTRQRADTCQYDISEALKLLQEFIHHDTLETGFLIQECLKGWMHHHEVLRKK
jgi:hypothetical protein